MVGGSRRFWALGGLLIAVNIAGWLLVRQAARDEASIPRLRVLSATPAGDAGQADRLALEFDEAVVPEEQVGMAATIRPFVVEPAPAGRWVWATVSRLEYRLDEPLPAGRVYRVRPVENLETTMHRRVVGPRQFEFRTASLAVTRCDVDTADDEHVTIRVTFNQPVEPQALREHVRVTWPPRGTEPTEVRVLERQSSTALTIQARKLGDAATVEIGKSLTGVGGELGLGNVYRKQLRLPVRFALLSAHAWFESSFGERGTAVLRFNGDVDEQQATPRIELSPAVEDLRVSIHGERIELTGRFRPGQAYEATVPATLASEDGKALGERQTAQFELPDRSPAMALSARRGYLMPAGNMTIDLKAVNVSRVQLTAARVYANNLTAHLRGDDRSVTSRELASRDIELDLKRNEVASLAVDLRALLGEGRGVYHVSASEPGRWYGHEAVVAVTDLALTTKQHREGMTVWVTSLRTAKPINGATVRVISRTNQVLAQGTTGDDGLAAMTIAEDHPDGEPWVVIAEHGDDMTFIEPADGTWGLEDADTIGRESPTTYDVMVYTERGVYRPGEAVQVTGIVRDATGATPPGFAMRVVVTRPDGRQIAELPVTPIENGQGLFHVTYESREDGQRGEYRFDVTLPGSPRALGSTTAHIESFVPVRIELTAEPTKRLFRADDTPTVRASARYLFGQPASELPIRLSAHLMPVAYRSASHGDYEFTTTANRTGTALEDTDAALDASGTAQLAIAAPPKISKGLWDIALTTTVTEIGGRSVSSRFAAKWDTAGRHVGLKLPVGRVATIGEPIEVKWVRVDGDDKPVGEGDLTFELQHVTYDWIMQQVDGRWVWKSKPQVTSITKQTLSGDAVSTGSGAVTFTCDRPGEHRVLATDAATGVTTRIDLYAAEPGDQRGRDSIQRPQRVEIVTDRHRYAPDEQATVLVRSPFAGTLLLTMESDRIIERRTAKLTGEARTATFTLPVPADLRGGAFVTATVIRPIDPHEQSWLPHRAMGVARLVTDHESHRLAVEIDAPPHIEPGQSTQVVVKVTGDTSSGAPALVHLWAVDEGILLTTAHATPDPMTHFFAPRRWAVTSADIYDELLPDHKRPSSMQRIGADGDDKDALSSRRMGPVAVRRRAAAVVWRQAVPLDADGRAVVALNMPDLTGEMRLMAVAIDGDRYGSAQRAVTVTAPLLVEASWPRFVALGDRFRVPVKLFASTDGPVTVDLTCEAAGPIAVKPLGVERGITVEPGRPVTVWLDVEATGIGDVDATITARATDQRSSEPMTAKHQETWTVRPIASLHTTAHLARIDAGDAMELALPGHYMRDSARARLSISPRPAVQLRPAVEALIRYPYGCAEQTSSTLYGLLYAPQLLRTSPGDANAGRAAEVERMVSAGLARLWSMQTPSGGMAYWAGDDHAAVWVSAYVAALLLEADQAGYAVEPRMIDDLVDYIERRLAHGGGDGEDDSDRDAAADANVRALMVRVLATFGRPQHGWMARLSERLDQLDVEGRAHLAAAWHAVGQRDRALAALPDDTLNQAAPRTSGGRLTSPVRGDAVLLSALLTIDADHPWIPSLVARLEQARGEQGAWSSTLDNAAAIAALARYQLLGDVKADFTGAVVAATGRTFSFTHHEAISIELTGADLPLRVATQGEGDVYVAMTTEGYVADAKIEPFDRQLQVRRRWLNRGGESIDPAALRSGDMVIVEVEIAAPGLVAGASIDNVAIVDALPGGFEVENPRLAVSALAGPGIQRTADPDRVEFLDDRVVLFTSVGSAKRVFRYVIRAVNPGRFAAPPIEASSMYDTAYAGLHRDFEFVEISR